MCVCLPPYFRCSCACVRVFHRCARAHPRRDAPWLVSSQVCRRVCCPTQKRENWKGRRIPCAPIVPDAPVLMWQGHPSFHHVARRLLSPHLSPIGSRLRAAALFCFLVCFFVFSLLSLLTLDSTFFFCACWRAAVTRAIAPFFFFCAAADLVVVVFRLRRLLFSSVLLAEEGEVAPMCATLPPLSCDLAACLTGRRDASVRQHLREAFVCLVRGCARG